VAYIIKTSIIKKSYGFFYFLNDFELLVNVLLMDMFIFHSISNKQQKIYLCCFNERGWCMHKFMVLLDSNYSQSLL